MLSSRGGGRARWFRETWLSPLGVRAEGVAFLLLCAVSLVLVRAVEEGAWVPAAISLKGTIVLGLLAGVGLARLRLPAFLAYVLAAFAGLSVVLGWGQAIRPEPEFAGRIGGLLVELFSWWRAVSGGETIEGVLAFAMLIASLTWVTGFLGGWSLFRWGNGWVVFLMGSAALLVNLSQLPESRYAVFLLFLFAALALMAYTGWARRALAWKKTGFRTSAGSTAVTWAAVLLLGAASLLLAWQVPKVVGASFNGVINQSVPEWRERSQALGERLFAGVRPRSSAFSGSEALRLQGTTGLGDTVLFVVGAEEPYFWREKSFDTYTSQGWVNASEADREMPPRGRTAEVSLPGSADVLHRVRVKVRTDILLTTGQPLRASVPSTMTVVPQMTYDVDLSRRSAGDRLPADIAAAVRKLESGLGRPLSESLLREALPADVEVVSVERRGGQIAEVKLRRRQAEEDIVSVRARRYMSAEQDYAVLSAVSVAAPSVLRLSDGVYPAWIGERYLQLPPQLPARVRTLAREVAGEEANAYDRAKAVKDYLHQIPYAPSVGPPTGRRDVVDYFLFSSRVGYCEYYASAMTVMLRSLGIPARLVIGFTPGEWDMGRQLFVVRERNYHAWTEVYFPLYGWVTFDPTPPGGNNNAIAGVNVVDAPQPNASDLGAGALDSSLLDDELDDMTDGDSEAAFAGGGFSFAGLGGRQWAALIALLVVLLALLLVVRMGYRIWWGVAGREYARAVYAQMCWMASRAGLGPGASLTPREYSAQLGRALPDQAEAIGRIAGLFAATRYGPRRQLSSEERRQVEGVWRGLRGHLLRHVFWHRLKRGSA